MEWLQTNWLWIAIALAFFAMHFFGHGVHSSHRRHGRNGEDGVLHPNPPTDATAEQTGANGAGPEVAYPSRPALGAMPANSNNTAARTTTDEKHHKHIC